jgi:hypothetical protein
MSAFAKNGYAPPATSSPSVSAEQDPRSEVLATWTPSFSAHARREPSGVKVGLAEVNEAGLRAKSRLEVVSAYDRWRIRWVPETRFGV